METEGKKHDAPDNYDATIETIVQRLYEPDAGEQPEEVIQHSEILNSVRQIDPGCSSAVLLKVLDKLQFPSRVIEGELYWFVKCP